MCIEHYRTDSSAKSMFPVFLSHIVSNHILQPLITRFPFVAAILKGLLLVYNKIGCKLSYDYLSPY